MTTEELRESSQALFDRVSSGDIVIEVNQRYALEDIQLAHRDLEARKTTGSTVILP
jgi:NADPH2:quinone reductase